MSDEIKYLDFEINVEKAAGDEYVVRAKSGRNKAEIRFANPFNEDKRKVVRSTLTAAALRSASGQRKTRMRNAVAPEVREMKSFGALLFHEAIKDSVRECYQKCQTQADQQRHGMRLRLSLDPSLDDLPWEFLCQQDDFLALNPRSPVVRYIEGGAPCSLVKVDYPLQVLVVIAKPADEVPLDTSAEKDSITEALQPLEQQGLVRLTFIEGPNTWERMMDAFLPNRTHILHFIGHGTFDDKYGEGVLVMEDADGKATMIDSERLRVLVQGKSRLALIVLNSCLGTQGDDAQPFSSVAAGLVKSGIPAVIAMQFEISDDAARAIAETFYTSLALNMPVDAALTEARRRIFLSDRNSLEWATPILYMQVPDGQLFEFKEPRPKTESAKPVETSNAFQTNADKRYREAEAAMERGDWAVAVTAFRGAMVYVPNYRDAAEKLAICANRANAATLYRQAEEHAANHNYDKADALLDQASKADPTLDVKGLRNTIECGQKYLKAITELERGNQQTGADLLREVIRLRPDFAEAVARLDDLASGGSGLPGSRTPAPLATQPLQPSPGTPQPTFDVPELRAGWDRLNKWWNATPTPTQTDAPPASGFSWRRYDVANPNLRQLAEEMRLYLHQNGCEHQVFEQEKGWVVQGRKSGEWRGWLGMSQAATILIESVDNNLKVSIGGAKWIDKAAGAATGLFLGFTWVTTIIGVVQQQSFVDGLWQIAENYAKSNGGRQVAFG